MRTRPDVTDIESRALYNCSGLVNVSIGNHVESIGEYAFLNCSGLTTISIPDSVTSIGQAAFQGCSNLDREVIIPNSVTSIGVGAFNKCGKITSITIPFVGGSADATEDSDSTLFGYIFGRTSYDEGTATIQYYSNSDKTTYYIPSSLNKVTVTGDASLFYGAFYGVSVDFALIMQSATPPIFGENVLTNCIGLTGIYVPNENVTDYRTADGWRDYANIIHPISEIDEQHNDVTVTKTASELSGYFENLSYYGQTVNVTISDSSPSLSDVKDVMLSYPYIKVNLDLSGCTGLTELEANAFNECGSLYGITLPDTITVINDFALRKCPNLTSIVIPDNVTTIGSSAFAYSSGLADVVFSENLTTIGTYAFYRCNNLSSITIPNSVTSIETKAFRECAGLKSVSIGNGITALNSGVFALCSSLESVFISENVTSIGEDAFLSCVNLSNITIPRSINTIFSTAFSDCSGLTRVDYTGTIEDWCKIIFKSSSSNPLYNAPDCDLYVDGQLITDWVIPNSITKINSYAFNGCKQLTSVTIPNSVPWDWCENYRLVCF